MILLPYQQTALEGIHRHKYSVLLWSRQTGKSFLLSYFAIQRCIEFNNHKVLVISPSERQSKEFIEKVRLHITALKVAGIEFFEEAEPYILEARFPNKSRIVAVPSKPETVRGFSGDVIMDEASFFEKGHEVYQAVFPTITRKKEYKLIAISTPRSKKDIFYFLWETAKDDPLWFRMKLTIYDAINQGLQIDPEELKRGIKSERAWKSEYLCEFLDEEETLLPYETIQACEEEGVAVNDIRELKGEIYIGVDIGRRKDLTVIAILEKLGSVLYLRRLEVLEGAPFSDQFKVIDHICHFANKIAIDETGIGMQIAEELTRKWGESKVLRVYFTAKVKEELAERLRVKFQDRTIKIFPDSNLREDLHSVRRTITDAGGIRYEGRTEDGHADRFWALALAVYSSLDEQPKIYIPPVFTGNQWRIKHGFDAVS
jgi:phage FluMu gp28-like protein